MFNTYLVKALALALAASQIFQDKGIQLSFDSEEQQQEVVHIMQKGCEVMRGQIGEQLPFLKDMDPLIILDQKIQDAQKTHQSTEVEKGLKLEDLRTAYQIFCSGSVPPEAQALLVEVIAYYNANLRDLPEIDWLKNYKLPTYSSVADWRGTHLVDVFRSSRRHNLALHEIPEKVRFAFLAAEDQGFYDEANHRGVDARGLARAGMRKLMGGPKQGGSTITQQLVKNLVVGSKVSYERKLREMVLAYSVEKLLTKDEILELYENMVYFGRSAWGVSMAAEVWFQKPLEQLNHAEIAFLAGMPKCPNLCNPDRYPAASMDRATQVLKQMATVKVFRPRNSVGQPVAAPLLNEDEYKQALVDLANLKFAPFQMAVPDMGFHFMDEMIFYAREELKLDPLRNNLQIISTLNPVIQERVEAAVQESLVQYELSNGRAKFEKSEGNLSETMSKNKLGWKEALNQIKAPLKDVHWPLAVYLGDSRVGLKDGRTLRLKSFDSASVNAKLTTYDLIYVKVEESEKEVVASLRFRPEVQAAVVVMENNGRIVSMVGGFSHQISELNRAAHMIRSPGSTAKIATYATALQHGMQPNTLILDSPISIPYDSSWPRGGSGAVVTMRNALERSRNSSAARLVTMLEGDSETGLMKVLDTMKDCGLHKSPPRHFPAILGGGVDTTVLNVATCYASMVNGARRPKPFFVERIEQDGNVIHQAQETLTPLTTVDAESAIQLRRILQGVVVRGTAQALGDKLADVVKAVDPQGSLADYVGGKTGTSQNSIDAWFAGFTKDLTIVVWVGYDNRTEEEKKTLGSEATAAMVAVPVWERVFRATLDTYPLEKLPEPVGLNLVAVKTGLNGSISESGVVEYHRTKSNGEVYDTRTSYNTIPVYEPPLYDYYDSTPYTYPSYDYSYPRKRKKSNYGLW